MPRYLTNDPGTPFDGAELKTISSALDGLSVAERTTYRNENAQHIAQHPAVKMLVVSGPGTGKSTLFKQKIDKWLRDDPSAKVLALSFVRKLVADLATLYVERSGKAVEDSRFDHMMAITLDPSSQYKHGVIRCIASRQGDVAVKGFLDRSKLFQVRGDTLEHFTVTDQLSIKNEHEVAKRMMEGDDAWDFIGLEDPDIWIDQDTGLTHLYFTMPFIHRVEKKHGAAINLGHAFGRDLDSLEMTEPILRSQYMGGGAEGAKEVSIAPLNKRG